MNKRIYGKVTAFIAAAILIILLSGPETAGFAAFIDAIGLDLFLLLLEVQLLAIVVHLSGGYLLPVARFFLKFSIHPFFVPTWGQIKKNPGSVAFAFPAASIIMFFLLVGTPAYITCLMW